MWRAGFGPAVNDIDLLKTISQKDLVKQLVKDSDAAPASIDVAGNAAEGLVQGMKSIEGLRRFQMSQDEKKAFRKQSREDIKSLNLAWLDEMTDSRAQLREKMAFFWHGHFASRNLNIFYQQLLLNVIRSNSIGNFRDLLHEVSKSAAMLNFLNNNQNRKDHPNENFAREVMELFTLGRGNYTEQDVKEAARAFTGWGANAQGEFVFRRMQHDSGVKTFLGRTGNFDGDDILDILLGQPQTATFITGKIYLFLVNDRPDPARIASLAKSFRQNNYNILALATDIFNSDWFYDNMNIGARIKSPVELLAGIRRMLPMEIRNGSSQLLIQRLLGQLLFYPPNVAGWPGGANWIDGSALMFRLRLPELIYSSEAVTLAAKPDDDQMMGRMDRADEKMAQPGRFANAGQIIDAVIDWTKYIGAFEKTRREQLPSALACTFVSII